METRAVCLTWRLLHQETATGVLRVSSLLHPSLHHAPGQIQIHRFQGDYQSCTGQAWDVLYGQTKHRWEDPGWWWHQPLVVPPLALVSLLSLQVIPASSWFPFWMLLLLNIFDLQLVDSTCLQWWIESQLYIISFKHCLFLPWRRDLPFLSPDFFLLLFLFVVSFLQMLARTQVYFFWCFGLPHASLKPTPTSAMQLQVTLTDHRVLFHQLCRFTACPPWLISFKLQ